MFSTTTKAFAILLTLVLIVSCKEEETIAPIKYQDNTVQDSTVQDSTAQDSTQVKEDTIKTLLVIGNSYSRTNFMLESLVQMATSTGDSLYIRREIYQGARIVDHAKSNTVINSINSMEWDFVSIQTHSQESALPQAHIDTAVFPSIRNIVSIIKQNSPETTPLYYRTWAYEEGSIKGINLCDSLSVFCDYNEMDSLINERYSCYASLLKGHLAPVGNVWRYITENHPEIDLYVSDGSHPTQIGAYINACIFYTMIFEKSPIEISYNFDNQNIPEEELAKEIVDQIVFQNLESFIFE